MERSDSGDECEEDVSVANELRKRNIPESVLELDHVFEALAHPRRRYLLYTLQEDTNWSLSELATKLAGWENDVPEESVGQEEQSRLYVSLYHSHVPKLVDDRVLRFDSDEETIRPGPNAEQVLAVLEGAGASFDSRQESHARGEYNE
ncbi:DUF7344 domain-containing protein [Halorussus halophilus]|uniref:DUF7344 domain-containing protein n=1 Tax=Halorussus halophilus TaxID=2650975 RepID=UPI0013011D97|nr:hypothetical protein [Halorussus halophilus]